MDPIRLLLVDDHDIVRTGLKVFLQSQPGLDVVGEAGGGLDAIRLAEEANPDVIIMDIGMPDLDGREATRRIVRRQPERKVLALTVHEDKQIFLEMVAAGAVGYITKQVAAQALVQAIQVVAAGGAFFLPEMAIWLVEAYRRQVSRSFDPLTTRPGAGDGSALRSLSRRELEVLRYVVQGLNNQQIGERLGISHKTVARHRERINARLDLHSCVDLVKFAIRSGLVELD
jgi:DNA-binding NarL/FixJ family response regulator